MSSTDVLSPVTLSATAATRVKKVLAGEAPGSVLRVAVDGGGCSGFQYSFKIVSAPAPDDLVLERDGAVVVIDPVSIDYMTGSEIDFVDDLIGQSFKIHNPNATASCGCGTSFAL
jgi:iron-sulfur cluster insertion protein